MPELLQTGNHYRIAPPVQQSANKVRAKFTSVYLLTRISMSSGLKSDLHSSIPSKPQPSMIIEVTSWLSESSVFGMKGKRCNNTGAGTFPLPRGHLCEDITSHHAEKEANFSKPNYCGNRATSIYVPGPRSPSPPHPPHGMPPPPQYFSSSSSSSSSGGSGRNSK